MEDKIRKILEDAGGSQINLNSKNGVDLLTKRIMKVIKLEKEFIRAPVRKMWKQTGFME